jgi:starch phosphorylase
MATLNLPAWGYGIRYSYGMFRQVRVVGGDQAGLAGVLVLLQGRWEGACAACAT